MIFGSESIAYYSKSNVAIWMSMAFQAGLLNIGGFLACHRFVSHVTGFSTFVGLEISIHGHNQALGMLSVPLFFLSGAAISGFLVDLRIKALQKPRYFISFGLIFFLLSLVLTGGVAGFFGTFGEPLNLTRDYALLALLCFICGIQNGTITTASRAVVRTTHLTGITTDLGLGIVRFLYRHKLGQAVENEGKANLMRIGIIFFFTLGSVAGGFAFKRMEYWGFLIPVITSGVLFAIMFYFQLLKVGKKI